MRNRELKPVLSLVALAVVSTLAAGSSAAAATPGLAPWLTQMGLTSSILSAANWGQGQVLGVVDTGIVANNFMFAPGQVSVSLSSCAAVSFKCSNGVTDDNGHGTAVASIAAGNKVTAGTYSYSGYTVPVNSYIGVAPNANIVAEKVLNASGSGYSTDVVNGINKAVAAGAGVINLSLTYMNSPDIITAINNAAAKGVFIVFAGGNSAMPLLSNANSNGLTAAAIKRLVFVGATDTSNARLASFSNTPGSGKLVSTTGAATTYASRWIDAPGVNILAPGINYGATAMALWSGTSMAAPLISGSLILLESAWPILKTNGTAADLLLVTATDMGSKGVDSTYGVGRVNLTTAFQPYGALSVTGANKKTIAVSSLTGSVITGGALGGLAAVKPLLANYTAFDTYTRNFTVNLSGLIQTRPTAATLNPLPAKTNTGVKAMKFSDGSELLTWQQPVSEMDKLGLSNSEASGLGGTGYVSYAGADGAAYAFGYGMPGQMSFARALFTDARLSSLAGASGMTSLSDLAGGGYHLAYGNRLGSDFSPQTRWAVSFSQTNQSTPLGMAQSSVNPDASNLTLGLANKLNDRFTGSLTLGVLNENNGLLGTNYDAASALSLGANRSTSLGLSLGYALSRDSSLLFEAGAAFTRAGSGSGLFAGTSSLQSHSWGMSFLSANLARAGDALTVSVKQPLRVVSGSVDVMVPQIDSDGVPSYGQQTLSLVPDGRQTDFQVSYNTPLGKARNLGLQLSVSKDALNIAGNNTASVGANWSMSF